MNGIRLAIFPDLGEDDLLFRSNGFPGRSPAGRVVVFRKQPRAASHTIFYALITRIRGIACALAVSFNLLMDEDLFFALTTVGTFGFPSPTTSVISLRFCRFGRIVVVTLTPARILVMNVVRPNPPFRIHSPKFSSPSSR